MKSGNIHFHTKEINYRIKNKIKLREWINNVFAIENCYFETVSFIFCSDDYLNKINIQYLAKDYLTDVITFFYNEKDQPVSGDIFISIDRIKENAGYLKINIEEELHRVMIHGVLHLIGFKDKKASERKIMTTKEDNYLSLRPSRLLK